jgi:hypothetical protein
MSAFALEDGVVSELPSDIRLRIVVGEQSSATLAV